MVGELGGTAGLLSPLEQQGTTPLPQQTGGVPKGLESLTTQQLQQLQDILGGNGNTSSPDVSQENASQPDVVAPEPVGAEALAQKERLRAMLRHETEKVGQHMINVTDFNNADDPLKMLQDLRTIESPPKGQKSAAFPIPIPAAGDTVRIRVQKVPSGSGEINGIVTISEFTGVRENDEGGLELNVVFKKPNFDQNGRLLSEDIGSTYLPIGELIDAQALANADGLRTLFPPDTEQGKVLEAYLVITEQKLLLGEQSVSEVLQAVGETSLRGKEIQSIQQAADAIFADDNLSEIHKVMNKEAQKDGLLTIDDLAAYKNAREQQLQIDENGKRVPLSPEGQDEITALQEVIKNAREQGRVVLEAEDMVQILDASHMKDKTEDMKSNLQAIQDQIDTLRSEHVKSQDKGEQKRIQDAIEKLQTTKNTLQGCQQYIEDPTRVQKDFKSFFSELLLARVDPKTGAGLRKALRTGDIEGALGTSFQGEASNDLWKKLLELETTAHKVGKNVLQAGGFIGLLLILLSSSLTKE